MKSKSNVLEYLAEAAKRRPGDTAVVDEFGNYTYKQLQDDSAAYGAALSEYDVANRGVVIMVEKCYDTLAIMLGTLFASGYYVPVDPSVPPCDLRTSSRHWEARSWWPTRKPCGAFNSKTRARSFPWRSCIASAPGYSSATRSSRHRFRSIRHTFCSPPDQRASPKA